MEVTLEMICQDILSLLARLKQEMLRLADERDLTPVQLSALYALHTHGELAMGKVAQVLHCDPSNVTGIIDRLVARNLVARQGSQRDRRTKTIVLTTEGGRIIQEALRVLPDRIGCGRLSGAERKVLHAAVAKIV